ncbi:hypothetical protein D3C81_1336530 [compost metagenome]
MAARFQPASGTIRYSANDIETTTQALRTSSGSTRGKPANSTMYSGNGSIRFGLKRNSSSSIRACCGLLMK